MKLEMEKAKEEEKAARLTYRAAKKNTILVAMNCGDPCQEACDQLATEEQELEDSRAAKDAICGN